MVLCCIFCLLATCNVQIITADSNEDGWSTTNTTNYNSKTTKTTTLGTTQDSTSSDTGTTSSMETTIYYSTPYISTMMKQITADLGTDTATGSSQTINALTTAKKALTTKDLTNIKMQTTIKKLTTTDKQTTTKRSTSTTLPTTLPTTLASSTTTEHLKSNIENLTAVLKSGSLQLNWVGTFSQHYQFTIQPKNITLSEKRCETSRHVHINCTFTLLPDWTKSQPITHLTISYKGNVIATVTFDKKTATATSPEKKSDDAVIVLLFLIIICFLCILAYLYHRYKHRIWGYPDQESATCLEMTPQDVTDTTNVSSGINTGSAVRVSVTQESSKSRQSVNVGCPPSTELTDTAAKEQENEDGKRIFHVSIKNIKNKEETTTDISSAARFDDVFRRSVNVAIPGYTDKIPQLKAVSNHG